MDVASAGGKQLRFSMSHGRWADVVAVDGEVYTAAQSEARKPDCEIAAAARHIENANPFEMSLRDDAIDFSPKHAPYAADAIDPPQTSECSSVRTLV